MNLSMVRNIVGKIMVLTGTLMIFPLITSLIYKEYLESIWHVLAFLIPMILLILIGLLLTIKKIKDYKMTARDGFIIVALSWLVMSLFGCIPFMISGFYGDNIIDAFFNSFFEMSSGFTTTGSTVQTDVESLTHSILLWRSISHWVGGMGVLVFILAIIPESKEGSSMHILRAESPGPQVGKLVAKMKVTSRILYIMYFCLTVIEVILLWIGDMNLFQSIIYSLGTAGTGGFSMDARGLELYSPYSQYVISIFMLIFSVNFTIYYLMLIRNWKEILRNEELRVFFIIVAIAVTIITLNIFFGLKNLTFEEGFRHALFQVASITSTTGYSSANFDEWPTLSKTILIFLMLFGACAGSTAGGIKTSRVVILCKSVIKKIKTMIMPRKVEALKFNGKTLEEETVDGVQSFLIIYVILLVVCALIISLDGYDLVTNFTASLACISNVGPGLSAVGPYGSFVGFSNLSKFVLSLEMIAGRLEIFPMLILFYPKTWMKR